MFCLDGIFRNGKLFASSAHKVSAEGMYMLNTANNYESGR